MEGDRLIEVVKGHDVQDRREGLVADDRRPGGDLDQGRAHVDPVAGAGDALTAVHRAALRPGAGQRVIHRRPGGAVDQRPDQDPGVARIADRQPGIGGAQPRDQRPVQRAVHDQPAQAGAALAAGPHR